MSISQNILPRSSPSKSIPLSRYNRRQAGGAAKRLIDSQSIVVGVALQLSSSGTIQYFALATDTHIHLIEVSPEPQTRVKSNAMYPLDNHLSMLLHPHNEQNTVDHLIVVGFEMQRLALHLNRDLEVPVLGVDLSTLCSSSTNQPWYPSRFIAEKISRDVDQFAINRLWEENYHDVSAIEREVCLRAWLTAVAGGTVHADLRIARRIDTSLLSKDELSCLAKMIQERDVLNRAKPRETKNEFAGFEVNKSGEFNLYNERYRTRVRQSRQTQVILTDSNGREYLARAQNAKGKATHIRFQDKGPLPKNLQNVRVVGIPEPNNSERARDELILCVLRGERRLKDCQFVRLFWFPSSKQLSNNKPTTHAPVLNRTLDLNPSQYEVVAAMTSQSNSVVITHGPPGTGKTTTISAAVKVWADAHLPVWIVAHSNVAVKNIAESFFKHGIEFRILVSKEFYVEWHEHIYTTINQKLLRSDELPSRKDRGELERVFDKSTVVLSTLSMLSNPVIEESGLFSLIPVEKLVVDEASQINVFEFMHIFHKLKRLTKVCYFGDPNQLPPYGHNDLPTLQSIFNVEHLRKTAYFLDTQYRMPVPLGDFISQHVYGRNLKSNHRIRSISCLSFIDVTRGLETKSGFSWKNMEEIYTIVHLVRGYYKHTNFCIITPYDAQRAAIQSQLKAEDLPWDCVYNVDSFQGNEADYIIISVVRTTTPGFLASTNRMNVLLTRCRAGMVIVTNRNFLLGRGQSTLLGKLCLHWTNISPHIPWIDWQLVAEHKADLPGAPGSHRPNHTLHGAPAMTPFSISYTLPSLTDRPANFNSISTHHFPPLPKVEPTSTLRLGPSQPTHRAETLPRPAGPAAPTGGRTISYHFQAHTVLDRAPLQLNKSWADRNASIPPAPSQIPSRERARGKWASVSRPFPIRGSARGRGQMSSGVGSATSRPTVRPDIHISSAVPASKSSSGPSQPFIRSFVINNIVPDAPTVTHKAGTVGQQSYAASIGTRKK